MGIGEDGVHQKIDGHMYTMEEHNEVQKSPLSYHSCNDGNSVACSMQSWLRSP